jgi:hypothetical protein
MLSDVFPPGTKVLLHGDGPHTVAGSQRDQNGVLVYALEEMRGYFWPADEVTLYQPPPQVKVPVDTEIPIDDTAERLELMGEVAKALNDEVIRQAPTHVGDTSLLDYDALARAAMDAIVKRMLMDMAALNVAAAQFEEKVKDG